MHVPQFLNSFCCVAILSEGGSISNQAELYCWTLYLLLKQHADKQTSSEKLISDIFKRYSRGIQKLSKICHDLLKENRIIFEGKSQFDCPGDTISSEFLEGLFLDVSDNHKNRYAFKHLSLMEFISALYICSLETYQEVIEDSVDNGLYDVVILSWQLISGCKYKGIIKDMFVHALGKTAEELEAIDIEQLLSRNVEYVHQCRNSSKEGLVKLLIDIILCFMNKDVAIKDHIVFHVKGLKYENLSQSVALLKISELEEKLVIEYKCTEDELHGVFKHLQEKKIRIENEKSLAALKYCPFAEVIEMYWIKTSISFIRKAIEEHSACKILRLVLCTLEDVHVERRSSKNRLKQVDLYQCRSNSQSNITLFNWLTSSVEEFKFAPNVFQDTWLEELCDALAEEKDNGKLTLKKVEISNAPMPYGGNRFSWYEAIMIKVHNFICYINAQLLLLYKSMSVVILHRYFLISVKLELKCSIS